MADSTTLTLNFEAEAEVTHAESASDAPTEESE